MLVQHACIVLVYTKNYLYIYLYIGIFSKYITFVAMCFKFTVYEISGLFLYCMLTKEDYRKCSKLD